MINNALTFSKIKHLCQESHKEKRDISLLRSQDQQLVLQVCRKKTKTMKWPSKPFSLSKTCFHISSAKMH